LKNKLKPLKQSNFKQKNQQNKKEAAYHLSESKQISSKHLHVIKLEQKPKVDIPKREFL